MVVLRDIGHFIFTGEAKAHSLTFLLNELFKVNAAFFNSECPLLPLIDDLLILCL